MTINSIKVHVRDNNTATLICPVCGAIKHLSTENLGQFCVEINIKIFGGSP